MAPEIGQAGFRIAVFLILTAACLLFLLPSGTAEFYVTVLTLLVGFAFVGVIALMMRILR